MSYLQKSLAPGETIVAIFRLHWSMWIRFWIVIVLGIVAVVALLIAQIAWGALAAGVLALLIAGYQWLWLRGIEQAVTNRRVVRKFGIVARDTTELRLASIETVDLRQSFWGRVFGYGDVEITGRGETAMVLDRIAQPIEVKREIESAYSSHIDAPVGGATA
ncbi:MAG TPA: PH domain-containing protein [Rhodanobacteraceae bacterium]|nr:PH domain-containing protein [Rhodanobacteraceae bacterium]